MKNRKLLILIIHGRAALFYIYLLKIYPTLYTPYTGQIRQAVDNKIGFGWAGKCHL